MTPGVEKGCNSQVEISVATLAPSQEWFCKQTRRMVEKSRVSVKRPQDHGDTTGKKTGLFLSTSNCKEDQHEVPGL